MSALAEVATLRGGYTMADVDRLAKVAARRHGGSTDFADRYDAAWFGITAALYSEAETPTERELLFAAIGAVQQQVQQSDQAYGRSHRGGYEIGSAPAFRKFWNDRTVEPSHEERIVERTALAQALSTLSGDQYEALAAAAACNTLPEAAAALGITYHQFIRRYYAARDIMRRLWLEGETPRLTVVGDDTCKSGHRRDEHTRTKADGKRYCQECQRLAKQRRRARGQR